MDDADARIARQGDQDKAARRAVTHLDSATVVVDPGLPKEMREALAGSGLKLVPYRGPVPAPTGPRGAAPTGGGVIALHRHRDEVELDKPFPAWPRRHARSLLSGVAPRGQ